MSTQQSVDINSKKNEHLVWDLGKLNNQQRAKKFIMQFEKTLCVYSGPVEQLYTNYNIYLPKDMGHKLVILPNPNAYHDTFNGLPDTAVKGTGINIIPGEMVGKNGLYITIPFRSTGESKAVPLSVGLHAIMKRQNPKDPFLPVVTKGDLRELDQSHPCLHLHRIQVNKLTQRSDMERKSIARVILEKLKVYMDDAQT